MTEQAATLYNYYNGIANIGGNILYNFNHIEKLGIDAGDVWKINNELITAGLLKRESSGRSSYGDTKLVLQ